MAGRGLLTTIHSFCKLSWANMFHCRAREICCLKSQQSRTVTERDPSKCQTYTGNLKACFPKPLKIILWASTPQAYPCYQRYLLGVINDKRVVSHVLWSSPTWTHTKSTTGKIARYFRNHYLSTQIIRQHYLHAQSLRSIAVPACAIAPGKP